MSYVEIRLQKLTEKVIATTPNCISNQKSFCLQKKYKDTNKIYRNGYKWFNPCMPWLEFLGLVAGTNCRQGPCI